MSSLCCIIYGRVALFPKDTERSERVLNTVEILKLNATWPINNLSLANFMLVIVSSILIFLLNALIVEHIY